MLEIRLSYLGSLEILQLIRAQGAISRSQLAENTGTSPFLVSRTCLVTAGFISEAGRLYVPFNGIISPVVSLTAAKSHLPVRGS
jgi:hypothetical protein